MLRKIAYAALVAGFFTQGCATTLRGRAGQSARVAKEVADAHVVVIKEVVDHKVEECAHLQGDRERLDACLGPVVSRPDAIEAAAEAVRTAQVGVYLALATDDWRDIRSALDELWSAVDELRRLVEAARKEGKQ